MRIFNPNGALEGAIVKQAMTHRFLALPWDNIGVIAAIAQLLFVLYRPPRILPHYEGTLSSAISLAIFISILITCIFSSRVKMSGRKFLALIVCLLINAAIPGIINTLIEGFFPDSHSYVYGDTVGIVAIAVLLGTRWALASATMQTLVYFALVGPSALTIGAFSIIVAWCAGKFRELGGLTSALSSAIPGLFVGFGSAVLMPPFYTRLLAPTLDTGEPLHAYFFRNIRREIWGFFVGDGACVPLEMMIWFPLGFWLSTYVFMPWISAGANKQIPTTGALLPR